MIMSSQAKNVLPAVSYDDFIKYEGFWYAPSRLEMAKAMQKEFKAEATDVILCSYPKSGTTWLKALAFVIMTRNKAKVINSNLSTTACTASENPLLAHNPHECVPFIEAISSGEAHNLDLGIYSNMKHSGRRLLSSHIPYTSLPKSVVESGCKIVYIYRDPKDVVVSLWHFGHEAFPWFQGISFQEMFENACQGKEQYGPIWDHVLGFWKAANERSENVLFLRYEDLKSHTSYYVKKLAEFLDEPFSPEEENGQVDKIIEFCSLEHLRNLEANKKGSISPLGIPISRDSFFRKGQVGDWKVHLTKEMKERMDTIIQDKFHGTGLNILI